MKIIFSEKAQKELEAFDKTICVLFLEHAKKISTMPKSRHLRFGVPFNVENVTKQARIVFQKEEENGEETLTILHCFSTHKEYERWYKSYR